MAVGQNQWYHLGVGAPPILEPILLGIGMFTGGMIWTLTHGHIILLDQTAAWLGPGIFLRITTQRRLATSPMIGGTPEPLLLGW